MKAFDGIDNQVLGAFIDGQLDAETSESIIIEMDTNAEVRERVYQLRRAKDLVRLGFSKATPASGKNKPAFQSRWKLRSMSMVASITALAISLSSALLGYQFAKHETLINPGNIAQTTLQQNPERILLHISESNTEHFASTLKYAEDYLIKHEANGGQIAVVANTGGLDFMREDISPFKEQIISLMKKYKNIHFIACANSVKLLRKKGVDLKLIDNVKVKQPAIDHIIDYVRDGWTYKKVETLVKT